MTILVLGTEPVAAGVTAPPAGITQPPKIPHTRRVINAARANGHKPLAKALENCCPGSRCGSYWCASCRSESCNSLRATVTSALAQFAGDHEAMRAGTRFTTVIHAVVPLNLDDVRAALKSGRKVLSRLPALFPGLVLLGAWELELMDMGMLLSADACEVKRRTILKLLGENQGPGKGRRRYSGKTMPDPLSKSGYAIIVHLHATAVLNGNEPERVRAWLVKQWPHARQVLFEEPWEQARQLKAAGFDGTSSDLLSPKLSGKAIDLFITKTSGYPFKDRVQFNLTWKTDGYATAPYIPDQQLARLVQYHHTLGKQALRVSVGLTRKRRQQTAGVPTREVALTTADRAPTTDTDPDPGTIKSVFDPGAFSERKSLNSRADHPGAELAIWQSKTGCSRAPAATAPGCARECERGDFYVDYSATLQVLLAADPDPGSGDHATTETRGVIAGAAERRRTL